MKNKKSIVSAAVIAGVLATTIVGGIGYKIGDNGITQEQVDIAREEAFKAGIESVELPICDVCAEPVVCEEPTTIEVPVDNGNLSLVLDEVYDADGDIEYLVEDLDEDEIGQIVDRIAFKTDSIALAEEIVKNEVVEYIDDEEDIFRKGDLKNYRDNDVYRLTIDEDETEFEAIDFEDKEATVFVEAKLKLDNGDDKTYVKVIAEVEIEGTEAEIVDVELK